MKYNFIKGHGTFYEVTDKDILDLQSTLDTKVPKELIDFWLSVGYGFIDGSRFNFNRFMDPLSVRDFRLRDGQFEYAQDIEIYDEFEDNKLIFFEGSEVAYISIGMSENDENAIYYYDVKIADSLKEFLEKLKKDDNYYDEL